MRPEMNPRRLRLGSSSSLWRSGPRNEPHKVGYEDLPVQAGLCKRYHQTYSEHVLEQIDMPMAIIFAFTRCLASYNVTVFVVASKPLLARFSNSNLMLKHINPSLLHSYASVLLKLSAHRSIAYGNLILVHCEDIAARSIHHEFTSEHPLAEMIGLLDFGSWRWCGWRRWSLLWHFSRRLCSRCIEALASTVTR